MSYKLIDANNIAFNSDGFITAENIVKMPCIYADLPNGMDGEHYVLEQEPKTGHWIEHPEIETSTPEYLMFYECSECGDKQCFCKSDIHKKHFCNNCGARMVEPQERSDKE